MAPYESHIDDEPLAFGTHARGNNSSDLVNPGKHFKSSGVRVDMLLKNTTDGSEGAITAVTQDTITATLAGGTDNDWDVDDEYEVYLTGTEDEFISSIYTDKSRGWKVTHPDELDEDTGWFPEDVDLDEDDDDVFGPGQPSKQHD